MLRKKIFYTLTIMIITLLTINIVSFCYYTQFVSIKYSKDYSTIDYIKTRKIILEIVEPTDEMFEKYDMDENGEITDSDAQIIKQMILGFYDSYEVKNNNVVAVKYEIKGEN